MTSVRLVPLVLYVENHKACLHLEKALIHKHEQEKGRTKGEEGKEESAATVPSPSIRMDGFMGCDVCPNSPSPLVCVGNAAIDNIQVNGRGCAPVPLHSQRDAGCIPPAGSHGLLLN